MRGLRVLLVSLVWTALTSLSVQTETFASKKDICRLFKDGTLLRKPGFCNQWIRCENFKSVDAGTCAAGRFYKLSTRSCSTLDRWDSTYCNSKPCTKNTNGYIADTKNCRGWHFCDKVTSISNGLCPEYLQFDQKKQMCNYEEQMENKCAATFEFCNVVPENTPFPNEVDCASYLTCKGGKLVVNKCAEGNYYDLLTAKCIKKSLVKCVKHPHPNEVCGTTKLAIRNHFVGDGATCRGYFYCRDLGAGKPDTAPNWGQCEPQFFFDPERERCLEREDAKCYEDRCDGRGTGRELSQTKGCQHYLECLNNAEMGEFKCEHDKYFDVRTQTCVDEKRSYGACAGL